MFIRGLSFGLHSPSVPHESQSSIMLCISEKDPPKHILVIVSDNLSTQNNINT